LKIENGKLKTCYLCASAVKKDFLANTGAKIAGFQKSEIII